MPSLFDNREREYSFSGRRIMAIEKVTTKVGVKDVKVFQQYISPYQR